MIPRLISKQLCVTFILYYCVGVDCQNIVHFLQNDIRFSRSRGVLAANTCTLQEECLSKCLAIKACHNVRLFPVGEGFVAEYLRRSAGEGEKKRVYQDLNGEPNKNDTHKLKVNSNFSAA